MMRTLPLGKIAFTSTMDGIPWGGSEELWSQTAKRLVAQGYQVGVNLKQWPIVPRQVRELQDTGCEVEFRRPLRRIERIARRFSPERGRHWLDRFQPSLLVISQGGQFDGYEWAEECRKRHLKYVLIAQAAAEAFWPTDEQAIDLIASHAGARVSYFVSQGNLNLTQKQMAYELVNAKVIRNPFNVSYDASPEWPVDETVMSLACVARLEPKSKGQDVLFEVMADEKWRQRPLHVTLYGDGLNCQNLKTLKDQYRLTNVEFGGFSTDITQVWQRHHALILPSRLEGLPLAMVEAMLCGRPCIATDVAGHGELVEDEISGFIADAPVKKCLDEAMERAWQRRSDWKTMGQAAAQRVRALVPRDPIDVFTRELISLLD